MKIQVRADDAVSETNEWSGNKVTHTLARRTQHPPGTFRSDIASHGMVC